MKNTTTQEVREHEPAGQVNRKNTKEKQKQKHKTAAKTPIWNEKQFNRKGKYLLANIYKKKKKISREIC